VPSVAMFFDRVILVSWRQYSCNKYIFETLVIIYSLSCRYVWKLFLGHTYYGHSVLTLKLGVTLTDLTLSDNRADRLTHQLFVAFDFYINFDHSSY
jgi:hypothetical protein